MAVTAEEETGLTITKKWISKTDFDFLVWLNDSVVGKRRLMTTNNYVPPETIKIL